MLPNARLPVCQREVRDFEPRHCADAGEDGLSVIRRLLVESSDYLKMVATSSLKWAFDQH